MVSTAILFLVILDGQAAADAPALATPGVTLRHISSTPGWTCPGLPDVTKVANAAIWLSWVAFARPRERNGDVFHDGRKLRPEELALPAQQEAWDSWGTPVKIRVLRRTTWPAAKWNLVVDVTQTSGSPLIDLTATWTIAEAGLVGLAELCPGNTMEFEAVFTPVANASAWREGVLGFLHHPIDHIRSSAAYTARVFGQQDTEMLNALRTMAKSDESTKVRDAAAASVFELSPH